MRSSRSGSVFLIALVIGAAVVIGAGGTFLYVNTREGEKKEASPLPPESKLAPVPKKQTSSEAKTKEATPPAQTAAKPPVVATPSATIAVVETEVGLSASRQMAVIKFIAASFNKIGSISYTFTYDVDPPDPAKVVKGTITVVSEPVAGYVSGKPYFRREVTLGVCSQNACVYDKNPRNFQVLLTTKPVGV